MKKNSLKLSFRIKLFGVIMTAIVPFFLVTVFGYQNLKKISKEAREFASLIDELNLISTITIDVKMISLNSDEYLLTGDISKKEKFKELSDKAAIDIINIGKLDFGQEDDFFIYGNVIDEYLKFKSYNRHLFDHLKPQNERIHADLIRKELGFLTQNFFKTINKFHKVSVLAVATQGKLRESAWARVYRLFLFAWIGAIIVGILTAYFISKYVSVSIISIVDAAKSIGSGNLGKRIAITSTDEFGYLSKTINKMAEALQKSTFSREYVDNIMQTMREILIVIDIDGNIKSINRYASQLTGYDEWELIGIPFDSLFMIEKTSEGDEKMNASSDSRELSETLCRAKSGEEIPVLFSTALLYDRDGNAQGTVFAAIDITDRKRAEEEIKYLSRQIIQIQEDERAYIARELHDNLGGSLTALKILIHALFMKFAKKEQSDSRKKYSELMEYLDGIIDTSRQISGNLSPIGLKKLGLTNAVKELANTLQKIKELHITIDLGDIDAYFPERWDVNLFRIIQESLNNILKHSDATEVAIKSDTTGDALLLSIRDNGKGISASVKKNDVSHGGLGISIMRERASLLSGSFEIISHADKGTEICIEIPKR